MSANGRWSPAANHAATSGGETRLLADGNQVPVLGLGSGGCLTDALRVAAEEVDQDRGDDLDRGVVVVSVERHQARAGYRGRLLGD